MVEDFLIQLRLEIGDLLDATNGFALASEDYNDQIAGSHYDEILWRHEEQCFKVVVHRNGGAHYYAMHKDNYTPGYLYGIQNSSREELIEFLKFLAINKVMEE